MAIPYRLLELEALKEKQRWEKEENIHLKINYKWCTAEEYWKESRSTWENGKLFHWTSTEFHFDNLDGNLNLKGKK